MKRFMPPPPDPAPASPFAWGRQERIRELLGDAFDLRFETGTSFYREPTPEAAWHTFSTGYGPTRTLYENLDGRAAPVTARRVRRVPRRVHERRSGSACRGRTASRSARAARGATSGADERSRKVDAPRARWAASTVQSSAATVRRRRGHHVGRQCADPQAFAQQGVAPAVGPSRDATPRRSACRWRPTGDRRRGRADDVEGGLQ